MDGNQQEVISFDTYHPSSHISSLSFFWLKRYNFQIIQIALGTTTVTADIAQMVTSFVLTADDWLLLSSRNK